MKKMIAAMFVCFALTVLFAIPVFANCIQAQQFDAAATAAEQRAADYIAYQNALVNFQAGEVVRGIAQRAQLRADYEIYQAQLAAFQANEVAKGILQRAQLKADYDVYQAQLAAYQANEVAKGAALRACAQNAKNSYDARMANVAVAVKAQEDAINALRGQVAQLAAAAAA